jgi:hypothetical protein
MIRKISLLVASVAIAAGMSLVAVAPAQGTGTSVLDAKLHAGQVFDVQRYPNIYPFCSIADSSFVEFSVSGFADPITNARRSQPLGDNYLKLAASGNASYPWRLAYFDNATDQELKYTGSAWVGPSDGAYASATAWSDQGNVYGLYSDGFFFVSYPGGIGSFVSLVTQYSNGASTSYTPTSEYNDCIDGVNGEVAEAKGTAIDPNSGGGGPTPTPTPTPSPTPTPTPTPTPNPSATLDLALDLQVGADFVGASSVITGSGLQASSAYDLTMHSDPIVIYQGTTDPSGNFTETITIPQDACLQGVHELILTGIDPAGNPVSDTKYIELGYNCEIVQLSDTAIVATAGMPDTGASVRTTIIVSVSAAVVFAFAFFAYASRRKLRFAWTNDRVASLMDDLDARLTGMEQRAKAAAARRKLRK